MNIPIAIVGALVSLLALFLGSRHQAFERVKASPVGPTLRVLRAGHGGPTVVFESGAGSPLETWVRVQPEVSRFTSTFAYDRAGLGLSTRGATPRDGLHIAADLHAALIAARASPPYILVGHSLGGPFIRIFAGQYPDEVAGLVLVDPTQEDLIEWARAQDPRPPREQRIRPDDEVDCAELTFAQAKDSQLPPVPVLLICGVGPQTIPDILPDGLRREVQRDQEIFYPAKLKFHRNWVESLPHGTIVVTQKSGHGIPWEEPELIVDVIRDVLARVQALR